MRILTVRQPWAWAIVHGGKDVENRVRNIAGEYRGLVAIHAGLSWDEREEQLQMTPAQVADAIEQKAHIVGLVELVDVHHFADCVYLRTTWQSADPNDADLPGGTPVEQEVEKCSPWAEEGNSYHLVLSNPRPLVKPIPFRGALGLRELPDDVAAAVLAGVQL